MGNAQDCSCESDNRRAVPRNVGFRDSVDSGWYQESTGEIFRGVQITEEDTVVDVGCGGGGATNFCVRHGAQVTSIDIDPEVVSRLTENVEDEHGRLTTRVSDGASLPLDDASVSRVICTEVLEHVDDPAQVLGELERIARPGALYLLTVPGALQEHMQKRVAHPSYFEKPNHIRIIEHDEFAGMVTRAGLEILEHTQYGFFWSVWFALFWACGVELDDAQHPVLDGWADTWNQLLDMEKGQKLKHQLDSFMPKSQVIVARKPETA